MARLNIDPDDSPTPSRESSLYRDPTPLSQLGTRRRPVRSSTRESTYTVFSPTPRGSSDKENDADPRDETPRPARRGKESMGPPKLPTPNSDTQHGNKRRRLGAYNIPPESTQAPDPDVPVEEYVQKRFYDPDQNPIVRRELRLKMRANLRDMTDRKDELVQPQNDELKNLVLRSGEHMKEVRQTSDAVIDSRFLVAASDLALKKTTNGVLGDTIDQIDVDEFVSKCITFMRTGGAQGGSDNDAPASTQARRQRRAQRQQDSDDEDDDIGDGLDWAVLGRCACFPTNKRPPVPNFLLGPLSVQKRVRVTQGRRGRLQTQARGPVTRPKSIERGDIEQAQNITLTHMVSQIKKQMKDHCMKAFEEVEQEMGEIEDASEEDYYKAMTTKRIRVNPDGEPAIDLFDLVINPHSFGQTVENLFYVSFLIKEGNAKVQKDRHGLPILSYTEPRTIAEQREQGVSKHQAVLSMDYASWHKAIKAYNIKEPLIPHRNEEEGIVTAKGWYA